MFLSTSYCAVFALAKPKFYSYLFILSSGVRLLYVHVYISLEMKLVFPPLFSLILRII